MNDKAPKGKKILLVDDERDIITTLGMRLEIEGYSVVSAGSGMQAVEMARKEKPDLIILDIRMPAGSGYQVYEILQRSEQLAGIPVLFLSALPPEEAKRRLSELGAEHFIAKPFDSDRIVTKIADLLTR
jgi:two-component system alkaline phosphatase synthesis response regulator PhoP